MFKISIDASGSLWIVPRPRGGDWLEDDLAALARRGVGVLVSLLCEDEQVELGLEQELAACASQNVDFLSLPVPDLGAPTRSEEFVMVVHRLLRLIEDGRGVGVHCRQSVGRSGLLAVSIAIAAGVPMDSAIEVVSRARGVRVPETNEQLAWLRNHARALAQPHD